MPHFSARLFAISAAPPEPYQIGDGLWIVQGRRITMHLGTIGELYHDAAYLVAEGRDLQTLNAIMPSFIQFMAFMINGGWSVRHYAFEPPEQFEGEAASLEEFVAILDHEPKCAYNLSFEDSRAVAFYPFPGIEGGKPVAECYQQFRELGKLPRDLISLYLMPNIRGHVQNWFLDPTLLDISIYAVIVETMLCPTMEKCPTKLSCPDPPEGCGRKDLEHDRVSKTRLLKDGLLAALDNDQEAYNNIWPFVDMARNKRNKVLHTGEKIDESEPADLPLNASTILNLNYIKAHPDDRESLMSLCSVIQGVARDLILRTYFDIPMAKKPRTIIAAKISGPTSPESQSQNGS